MDDPATTTERHEPAERPFDDSRNDAAMREASKRLDRAREVTRQRVGVVNLGDLTDRDDEVRS